MNEIENTIQLDGKEVYAPDYIVNAFTQTDGDINVEADNVNIRCLTSKNNKFSLDENGNLVVNSLTCNNALLNILDVYPIGSIYMNFNNINPSNLFGGTWKQLKGRFLIGQGSCEANTTNWFGECQAGWTDMSEAERGGEVKHKLTIEEIPKHKHGTQNNTGNFISDASNVTPGNVMNFASGSYKRYSMNTTGTIGGGLEHNNMPPYIVVYMWQRIS